MRSKVGAILFIVFLGYAWYLNGNPFAVKKEFTSRYKACEVNDPLKCQEYRAEHFSEKACLKRAEEMPEGFIFKIDETYMEVVEKGECT